MKHALSILAVVALAACGGGGGSGGGFAPVAAPVSAPIPATEALAVKPLVPVLQAPQPLNTNCVFAAANHVACDLIANDQPIGVGVPPGAYVTFTNKTGAALQIANISGFTGERRFWSEMCAYVGTFMTGQPVAGEGEVGCSAKNVGEDYAPIAWKSGITVAPGQVVYLAAHTEPAATNHTYSLTVKSGPGLSVWRQPQHDQVIPCDGQQQKTVWSGLKNETARTLRLTGAAIYAESGTAAAPNTLSGPVCIYVLAADGSQKYSNCDNALRNRGDVTFPAIEVAPGESVAAQAVNACTAPSLWGWAAFLRMEGNAA